MEYPQKFVELLKKLIRDAENLLKTSQNGKIQDHKSLRKLSNELIILRGLGGKMIYQWKNKLHLNSVGTPQYTWPVEEVLSALETIKYAIDNDLFHSYREIIIAEAFTSLFEQGEYLLSQEYFLAAGVIFRAVLEEKLRELCEASKCMPARKRPTIDDLNQALYKSESISYDKTMMHQITALAAVGNDAAHNKKTLKKEDIELLKKGILDFISKYSSK